MIVEESKMMRFLKEMKM